MLPSEYLEQFIATLPSAPMAKDPDFGRDISAWDEVDPGWRMVQGDELLRQLVYRIITTAPYSMFSNPEFSLDIKEYLHTRLTGVEIGSRITARVKRHPNFQDCQTVVNTITDGFHLKILATPVGRTQPVVVETTVRS